jgi:protein CpxP
MKSVVKNLVACAALIAAIGLAPALSSAAMGDDGAAPPRHHLKKMSQDLNLSQQQQQQIEGVFLKSRQQMEPLAKQLKTERQAMLSLIHGDAFNEAAIRAQSAKVAAVEANMAVERARTTQEVRKLLTPEQVQKFKEIQAKQPMPGMMHGGKQDRKHGRMPCCEQNQKPCCNGDAAAPKGK